MGKTLESYESDFREHSDYLPTQISYPHLIMLGRQQLPTVVVYQELLTPGIVQYRGISPPRRPERSIKDSVGMHHLQRQDFDV